MGEFETVSARPAKEVELKFELEPEAMDRLEERLTVRAVFGERKRLARPDDRRDRRERRQPPR